MRNTTISTGALLMLLALAPGSALAETADGDPPVPAASAEAAPTAEGDATVRPAPARRTEYVYVKEPYTPDANTIAAKLPVPLALTPANVGTVSGLLMLEQATFALPEALDNVSGVHAETGFGVHDYFLIRGFDSLSSALVLTDGAAEPEATVYPTYNVEAVEVLKGPSGFLYGSNPLSGVVNVVRKQPVPADFLEIAGSVGSFDTAQGRLDWNVADDSGRRSFRLNGLWHQSDNYRDRMDSEHWAINPGFTLRVGERATLNVNLEYVEAEYAPDNGIPLVDNRVPDVPRRRSYQSPFDFSEQEVSRLQVDFQSPLGEGLTLRNKTWLRELDWTSQGTIFTGVFPNPMTFRPEAHRLLNRLEDRQRFSGNQLEAILERRTGPVEHDLLVGLETAWLTDDYALTGAPLPALDVFDPVETAQEPLFFFPIAPEGQAAQGDARTFVVAPYVIDQWKISERVRLLTGVRADRIDFEDDANGTSRETTRVSPMAGAVFSPRERTSLYANVSRSFAPPTARTLGDPRPERGSQVELGVKQGFLEDRLRGTLAVFRMDRENIAIPVNDSPTLQEIGDQRSEGLELELTFEPSNRTRAFLSYAYTDAELTHFQERDLVGFDAMGNPIIAVVDRSGNRPAFVPEHLARIWASRSFQNGLGVGGGLRYFSERFIDEDNRFEADAAAIVDATVFYRFPQWTVRLNVKNLTDEEYVLRGFGPTSVIPAPGTSAYLGFECRLR